MSAESYRTNSALIGWVPSISWLGSVIPRPKGKLPRQHHRLHSKQPTSRSPRLKFCNDGKTAPEDVHACLLQHKDELSDACRARLGDSAMTSRSALLFVLLEMAEAKKLRTTPEKPVIMSGTKARAGVIRHRMSFVLVVSTVAASSCSRFCIFIISAGHSAPAIGVDPPREFHVASILRRVWCCGNHIIAILAAILAITATIKRHDRYWPLWLWPNVPKVKN